jgi:CRISPR-associated protein Cas2
MSPLILCAYDVTEPRRLAAALAAVTAWSHGGQRSAFECFAARREAATLSLSVAAPLLATADRLGVFRPDRRRSFAVGPGRIAEDSPIVYVG